MKPGDWIGVDLDRTLAVRNSGDPLDRVGDPVPAMVARVKRWLAEGKIVKIVTARVHPSHHDVEEQRSMIRLWLWEHVGARLEIVCEKDHKMDELWDDLAVRVEQNTGRQLSPSKHGKLTVMFSELWRSLSDEERLGMMQHSCRLCGAVDDCAHDRVPI